MQVFLHRSAFKHGLSAEDVTHAWKGGEQHQVWLDDEHPTRLLRIGGDTAGRLVELVALVFDDERALIIHAMRARTSTLRALERRKS